MSREPVKQKGLATVSCIDGRWFQAKIGNPAVPASRVPLPIPDWEVRNGLAKLIVAQASLNSAPWWSRLLGLPRYKQAQAFHLAASEHFGEVIARSLHHQTVAERLQSRFKKESEGKVQP